MRTGPGNAYATISHGLERGIVALQREEQIRASAFDPEKLRGQIADAHEMADRLRLERDALVRQLEHERKGRRPRL